MAFSYSIFLALLLLFPGLCFWAGLRAGERSDFASPSPDAPNSTLTWFIIMLGTLFGHALGTGFYALQAKWCDLTGLCFPVAFDPNVYRALMHGASAATGAPDIAFEIWLVSFMAIGGATSAAAYWISRRDTLTGLTDPITFGWLAPTVRAVKRGDSFVVAYVMTKTNHDELTVAYEGIVQQLALDDDQSIKLIVLNEVDRFLVSMSSEGLKRVDAKSTPITQLQITAAEIANVALEVVQAPAEDVAAVEASDGDNDSDLGIATASHP